MIKPKAASFYSSNSLLRNATIITKEGNRIFSVASKEAVLKRATAVPVKKVK